ncbi:hypothetical protein LWI28_018035 [Acer negundo]|uniref:Transmembrane protein n=1 Tax=Acer negundo TaxID=4023 RepID=A0AAD5J5K5_ACENE|nr:hypothetical protein LWI28_018035 [Acer negundo]
MTGEEIAGPAAPKVLRFVYFIGAGFILTTAINKYRELERKSLLKKQQEENLLSESSTNAITMPAKGRLRQRYCTAKHDSAIDWFSAPPSSTLSK